MDTLETRGRLLLSLVRVGLHVHRAIGEAVKPLGVTPLELALLRLLALDQWTSFSSLARNLGLTRSGVRNPICRLERDGLLEVRRYQIDRRCFELRLLRAGADVLEPALETLGYLERQFCTSAEAALGLDRWLEERVLELRPQLRPPTLATLLAPLTGVTRTGARTLMQDDDASREIGDQLDNLENLCGEGAPLAHLDASREIGDQLDNLENLCREWAPVDDRG